MESKFNLIDEPWILVRTPDCKVTEVSLKEVFFNAHEYTELAGETKTQDFAILRLLLAIMHTVFSRYDSQGNEIENENIDYDYPVDNWEEIWNSKRIPTEPIERYFEKWKDRFWLFDEKYPFYQSNAVNGKGKPYSTAKMIGSLFESGNKARLFTERRNDGRILTYSESARWLLHLNCFDDIAAKKPTPKRTWASRLGLIALKGKNLFETLMLNFVADADENKKNLPSWEQNASDEFNRLTAIPDNQAELLSLQSRRIYLHEDNGMISGYYISGGDYFEEEDVYSEQMTVWRGYTEGKNPQVKIKPRLHNSATKSWQEFSSISEANLGKENNSGNGNRIPGVISWVRRLQGYEILDSNFMINISTAAVIYDYKQSTSLPVIDLISDNLSFHSQLLLDVGSIWRNRIYDEIDKCDDAANAVSRLSINLQKSAGAEGDIIDKTGGQTAKKQFYSRIDRPFRLWLARLEADSSEELMTELEITLKNIAVKLGKELAVQTGGNAVFGRKIQVDKTSCKYFSSAESLNIYLAKINKIFNRAGDKE